MTATEFRTIALSLPDVVEKSHHDHPDFRVGGKIFATLGYPERGWGMVRLLPDQQREYVRSYPGVFVPARGKWGLNGATTVHLRRAKTKVVEGALAAAWSNIAPPAKHRNPPWQR